MTNDGRNGRRVRHNRGLTCALAAMIIGFGSAHTRAQCIEEQKLTATDATVGDWFGGAVSVSGDVAVVGAERAVCADGILCGAAYVFRYNGTTWVEEQKLIASDAADSDFFGRSVSVSGGTVVVGASRHDCAVGRLCGSAYVFRFDGNSWIEEQELTASDAARFARFGTSVFVTGDTVLIGAFTDDCADGIWCGSGYVFRFNGTSWVEEQKLAPFDAMAEQNFGGTISVSGDTALISAASSACAAGDRCGAVYVFRFNGKSWVEAQKLTASDASPHKFFGFSVSLSGDKAVITSRGAAYAFSFDGASWVEDQKLTAATLGIRFGVSVTVNGNTAVVGASESRCQDGIWCGSAIVFHFNGTSWVENQTLTASDAKFADRFGTFVAMSGNTAMVGAFVADCEAGDDCGSVYVFSCVPPPTPVKLDIKAGGCPNLVNPNSKGVVPVAIVGSDEFDVSMIDPDSLTLARVDAVGGSIFLYSGRRDARIVIEDVATRFDGETCACHELGGDGIDDLTLTFSTSEMARALELDELPCGQTIELVLRGTLQDGTAFEGIDCIVIPGSRRVSSDPLLASVPARDMEVQFTEHVITATGNGANSVFAADVDGDGDTDVLSAFKFEATIAWYENDGDLPPNFTERVISTTAVSASAVFAADVDGDGDTDVLSASESDDKIAWYMNDGGSPPSFTERVISDSADAAFSVYAADVDGDGDTDVLSASILDDKIAWYENDGGSPPGFTERTISTTADGAIAVFATDVDGDGDIDVLSASLRDDKIAWYENDGGSPPSFTERVISNSADAAFSVFAADMDGDGDTDVLSASISDDKIAWYENDGGSPPSFTERVISTSAKEAFSVFASDMDGDGDMDVLSASQRDDKIAWYENDGGSPPSFKERVISNSADAARSVFAMDVDGDGVTDVLSASLFDDKIAWYENTTRPIRLDIKVDHCPNSVNPRSPGVVSVAIVGTVEFDVAAIDPCTLALARADGVGEGVAPLLGRRGPNSAIEDVATPLDGKICACHALGADGIDDLTLAFSTSEMTRALELNAVARGETIALVLRGALQDGTSFHAVDCIVIPGSTRNSGELRRATRSK